jgi:hypothetical protein
MRQTTSLKGVCTTVFCRQVELPGALVAQRGRKVALRGRKVALRGRKVALRGRKVALRGRKVDLRSRKVALKGRKGDASDWIRKRKCLIRRHSRKSRLRRDNHSTNPVGLPEADGKAERAVGNFSKVNITLTVPALLFNT